MRDQAKILIVGGTGKTGRRIVDKLAQRGIPTRVTSRNGIPSFDWNEPAAWDAQLAGIESVYLAYPPDLAVPRAATDVGAFATRAAACGVKHVVLLSGRGEEEVLPSEAAVQECGTTWTILRGAWFAQNFSEGHLLDPIRHGELAFPAGQTAEPFVDLDDLTDVAVAALLDPAHRGRIYELTGPRLLTFAEAVSEIAVAAGRPIRYVPVSGEAYEKALEPYLPAEEAAFLTALFTRILDGHNAHLSDGVERALGRPPRDFSEFAREAAATGVWAEV